MGWWWQEAKLFLSHTTQVSQDAIHVVASVAILLAAAAILRRPISSLGPWLVVLVLSVVNEFADLWIQQWPHPGRQYGEGMKDVILTIALPTLLLVTVRCFPRLYRPVFQPRAVDS